MITFGNPIKKDCKTSDCIHYQTILDLSNHAGLMANVVCPEKFCNWVWQNNVFQENNIPIEQKNNNEELQEELSEEEVLRKMKEFFLTKKVKLELYLDIDKEEKIVNFYNPLNNSPLPLTLCFDELKNKTLEQNCSKLMEFYKTLIEHFVEK